MNKANLIEKLNEAIALELGALLQYNQYSQVLLGLERKVWSGWFKDQSNESLEHARTFASRVVSMGGRPTCEPQEALQTTDLKEMLENSLALERRAVQIYTEALKCCEDHAGYRNLLEGQIDTETQDVEELEKFLKQVQQAGAQARRGKAAGA